LKSSGNLTGCVLASASTETNISTPDMNQLVAASGKAAAEA
jgi:hypothetical protein